MLTRSFVRSFSIVALGGVVLLGAGCSRSDRPAESASSTAPRVSVGARATTTDTTPTPVLPGSAAIVRGPCEHPYYPLRPGYEIHYSTVVPGTSGNAANGYALKVTDATATGVRLHAIFDTSAPDQTPITADQDIDCSNGGLIARSYLDLGSRIADTAAANQFKLTTLNSRGEMLPRDIRVGSEWTSGFDLRMEAATPGPGNPLTHPIDMAVNINRHVVGQETVRVPAGSYTALKIAAVTDMGMGTRISGTEWWVEGVGMVKSTYDLGSGSQNAITEATSVTVPR